MRRDMVNERCDKRQWSFVTYGTNVDVHDNGYSGSVEDNNLSVWSLNGRGKLVPASTDGLAFYYTILNPKTDNFTLSADLQVEQWTFSNGQDGFGLMVCDTIGEMGDETSLWNNSYMASVTKVQYFYDRAQRKASDVGERYIMHLGVGAQEKKGITKQCLEDGTQPQHIVSTMHTLETTAGDRGCEAGVYNIVGNYTNTDTDMHSLMEKTTFHLSIQRNNTGYIVSYTDENGKTNAHTFYHEDKKDGLTWLDNGKIYVGFYAARNAKMQVRNVELQTIRPEEDAPAQKRPMQYVTPTVEVLSPTVCNKEAYAVCLLTNADGKAKVQRGDGSVSAENVTVTAGVKCHIDTAMTEGVNELKITFTPDADYAPSEYERLSTYEDICLDWQVTWKTNPGEVVYIAPDGRADGDGSKEHPLDVQTALNGALPGQKLLLQGGTYLLEKPLVVERGIDGREDAYISLMPAEGEERAVFDFQRKCEGMTIGGDYWHFKNFTVTNTKVSHKGIHVGGSYNILEQICACRNGNTGLQISRYDIHDERELWPRYNKILNCTSYLNADAGYTDSDGFAAKITVAEGNVFEGCISAYNADDGFDLFAKVESGATGKVVIRHCLAFKNGYILDKDGKEVHVGLGNGFKLGGSSFACGHTLEESIAFANGLKGIDSNNCPDCKVYKAVSFNNEASNVAFYTTDAPDTDFYARGIVSFRDGAGEGELLRGEGSQKPEYIYDASNYYWDGTQSCNNQGMPMQKEWFVSTDVYQAIHGGITRRADGSIDRNGFLEYTDLAPEEVRFALS